MQFIDSHAHLTNKAFDDDRFSIVKSLSTHNISAVITIGCDLQEAKKAIRLANRYNNIYPAIGLYPSDTKTNSNEIGIKRNDTNYENKLLEHLQLLLKQNKNVVGIGECGLDFTTPPPWEIQRNKKEQLRLFERQIILAKAFKLPIVIHSRDAKDETVAVLQKHYRKGTKNNGVWHCFSEDTETANLAIERGFYISISGLATYNKTESLKQAISKIPIERILVETDSPFLVPQEARKSNIKRNEPQYVKMTAQKVAEIKGIPLEKVAWRTSENAKNLFKIR